MVSEPRPRDRGNLALRRHREQMGPRLTNRPRHDRARRDEKSDGTLPALAALKTIVLPSGPKRAFVIHWRSQVFTSNSRRPGSR